MNNGLQADPNADPNAVSEVLHELIKMLKALKENAGQTGMTEKAPERVKP